MRFETFCKHTKGYKNTNRNLNTTTYWCPKLLSLENLFEFIWNLNSSFKILKFNLDLKKKISCLKIYLKQGPCGVVQCVFVYLTLSCDKLEYTHMAPLQRVHVWNKFSDGIILFQIWIKFSNFKTWFKISNFKIWFEISNKFKYKILEYQVIKVYSLSIG